MQSCLLEKNTAFCKLQLKLLACVKTVTICENEMQCLWPYTSDINDIFFTTHLKHSAEFL